MQIEILMGPSGSGKSTYVKKHYKIGVLDAYDSCVSADYTFKRTGSYQFDPSLLPQAHAKCLRHYTHDVRRMCEVFDDPTHHHKYRVVVDNTNTTLVELAPYVALAQAYVPDVPLLITRFSSDIETCVSRNVHQVPRHVIERQIDNINHSLANWPRHWPPALLVE